MDVIVDGKPNAALGAATDPLAAVIAASEELQGQGRAMVAVRLDGEAIEAERLADALRACSAEQSHRIEIDSENVAILAVEVLSEFEEVLPELPEACHQLAQVLQGSTPSEGYESLQQLLDIWMHVKDRQLLVARSLGLDLGNVEIKGVPFEKLHSELNAFLTEAAGALEAGDNVLLGDLLEYELAPRAEAEATIIRLLRQEIEARLPQ